MTSTATRSRSGRFVPLTSVAFFCGALAVFSAVTAWVLANGYVNPSALHRWSRVIANLDTQGFRVENFGLLYPHLPVYGLSALHFLPAPYGAAMPYFLGVLTCAWLLTLWNGHLRKKGYSRGQRVWLVGLVASNPLLLWAASTGLHNALLLFGFYVVGYGCYLVVRIHDVRTLVFVSASLALLFFADERVPFLLLGLLPLIPFFASPRMIRESVASVYAVLIFPVMVAVFAWVYLNWIFHGDPWFFLRVPESVFLGGRAAVGSSHWLSRYGGHFSAPTLNAIVLALLCFPLPLYLAIKGWRQRRSARAVLVLFGHLPVVIGLATTLFFVRAPVEFLYLLLVVTMVSLLLMPRQGGGLLMPVVLLLAGNLAAGGYLLAEPAPDVVAWRTALSGTTSPPAYAADQGFGRWLRDNPAPTLMDDRPLFAAIVARSHGRDLVLPHSDRFKRELRGRVPGVEQVVVVAPGAPAAAQDRVGQRYPDLYWSGAPGYQLVFDEYPIRVYRRSSP